MRITLILTDEQYDTFIGAAAKKMLPVTAWLKMVGAEAAGYMQEEQKKRPVGRPPLPQNEEKLKAKHKWNAFVEQLEIDYPGEIFTTFEAGGYCSGYPEAKGTWVRHSADDASWTFIGKLVENEEEFLLVWPEGVPENFWDIPEERGNAPVMKQCYIKRKG